MEAVGCRCEIHDGYFQEKTKMAGKAFFLQRMNEHIRYLNRINASLDNEGDFCGSSHTECKLGAWIYGEGSVLIEECGEEAKAIFEKLKVEHQAFHEISHKALEFSSAGDNKAAQLQNTAMHKLSNQLIQLLMKLEDATVHCEAGQ
jgi:hypothetical protein